MGMSTTSAWHVDDDALRAWVDGTAGPVVSISVEQHVARCARCQGVVATVVPPEPLAAAWAGTLAAVETPRQSRLERALRRVGVSTADAMVLSAATALRTAWLVGTIGVLGFAVVAPLLTGSEGEQLFLAVAPLIPVAGVAMSYGPGVDPSYEAVLVSPYSMLRLVLLRTALVLSTSVPLVVVTGLLLPMPAFVAVAWLLPAAGFVAVVLTASSWFEPEQVATAVALGWLAAVAWAARVGDPLLLVTGPAVPVYLTVLVTAAVAFVVRVSGRTPSWRLR
jgi:hypothetical protein